MKKNIYDEPIIIIKKKDIIMIIRERVHLFCFFARAEEFNNKRERLREKRNSVTTKIKTKKNTKIYHF